MAVGDPVRFIKIYIFNENDMLSKILSRKQSVSLSAFIIFPPLESFSKFKSNTVRLC